MKGKSVQCTNTFDTDDTNRDEALRQTRRLEAAIGAEREKVRMLFGGLDLPQR